MKKSCRNIETQSIALAVTLKFLLALILLLLTQGIFAIVNAKLFSVNGAGEWMKILLGNLQYGLAGTAMMLSPYILMMALPFHWRYKKGYQTAGNIVFGICAGILLAVNMIDVPYFQWTLRRMAGDIFGYVGQNFEGGASDLLKDFVVGFWYYFLIYFALLALLILGMRRIRLCPPTKKRKWWSTLITSLLMLFITLTFVRGGFISQHKPLAPIDACKWTRSGNTALVVNTPFSIIRTLGNTSAVKEVNYFPTEAALDAVFSPMQAPLSGGSEQRMNVVLLILESFGEEYMGCINGGAQSWTPFLDSLSNSCTVLQGRANGKRSIESVPALFLGIPSLMDEAYITSSFALKKTESLPQILHRHGYETAFFHGAYNGSMNFDGFTKMIGIQHYYGMNEYNNSKDFDGSWGIFDEPFLQYSVRQISSMQKPFFSTIYTISSHHPYTIPPQYKGRFKKGPLPLLETVNYVDYALRKFFESASKTDWYKNTMFIIAADHAARPLSQRYKAVSGMYNVPMLLYCPGGSPKSLASLGRDRTMQHIDLMPTVIDLLQLNEGCCSFGKSVLRGGEGYHVAYPSGCYELERNGYLLTLSGEKFEVFDLRKDPLGQHNIEAETLNNPTINDNKQFLKAVIQQYNNRMVENKLLYKSQLKSNK